MSPRHEDPCPAPELGPARCRACDKRGLLRVLDLGAMPLVNGLWQSAEGEGLEHERFPLTVGRCPSCGLVQLEHDVPPERMFREYSYFSSYAETMLRHARAMATELTLGRRLDHKSHVIEIASNDGYLLQYYKKAGIPVLGIEPARNVAEVAERERGIPTIREFFGEDLARTLAKNGQMADVVHASNVLAHVPDLRGFLKGIKRILKDDGVAVIEVPHMVELYDHAQFDTIYHEHLSYFTFTSLSRALAAAGLSVRSVRKVDVHGGSLRVVAQHAGLAHPGLSTRQMLDAERVWGVDGDAVHASFARKVEDLCHRLRCELGDLRASGARLAGYGASAKGCVLLNALGLPPGTLSYVVDKSPHKVGRFVPGVGLPIVPIDHLHRDRPDALLLLVWNLVDEIMQQEAEYLRKGGRFVLPLPERRAAA